MSPLRLGIAGAGGRMGRALVRLAAGAADLRVAAALTHAADANIGRDAGTLAGLDALGVVLAFDAADAPDVLIDFTTPTGCAQWARWCAARRVPLVSGTTGLDAAAQSALATAARSVPVLWAANMSLGANLLAALVEQAAARLDAGWDVEIVEAHHNRKADAPSGTARALLEAVARGRGPDACSEPVFGRSGQTGPRAPGVVGVHAVRMGGVVGDHDVHFASPREVLTLGHRALSRDVFADGALAAARWIVGRPAGTYSMADVIG